MISKEDLFGKRGQLESTFPGIGQIGLTVILVEGVITLSGLRFIAHSFHLRPTVIILFTNYFLAALTESSSIPAGCSSASSSGAYLFVQGNGGRSIITRFTNNCNLSGMSLNTKIRKLDMFKKVPSDLSSGTNVGGAMSLLAIGLIIFFIVYETSLYFNQPESSIISMDQLFTRKELNINIDIEFPKFPCEIISLDLQDIMMSHHPNIGSIKKWRLDSSGNYLDREDFQLLREPDQMKQLKMAEEAFQKGYGCRLIGSFTVKEVPGNFHISSHAYQNIYVRLAMNGAIKTLDVSHKIHSFYFGEYSYIEEIQARHNGSQLTPLNGHTRIYDMATTPHSYISHYHIDIVPTTYSSYLGSIESYQYTYNHNSFEVGHMPALYFNYHVGGTSVYTFVPRGFMGTFLLNLCAVIGGIYALCSFINNTLHMVVGDKGMYQELGQ